MKKIFPYKHVIIVVAHADDEALFAGGLMLKYPKVDFTVLVVTQPDKVRIREAKKIQKKYDKLYLTIAMPDIFDKHLDKEILKKRLKQVDKLNPDLIITHNSFGEYGHWHHVDIHNTMTELYKEKAFGKADMWLFGHNTDSDITITGSDLLWRLKKDMISMYKSQLGFVRRFPTRGESYKQFGVRGNEIKR